MRKVAVFLLIVLGILAVFYFLVRGRGFSAREKPSSLESFIAIRVRSLAMPRDSKVLKNPLPATELNIAEGRDHFADHCGICHANNGGGETPINEGLYPPAPDLRQSGTQNLTDGEIFYIVKNGVRFTGMPGWDGEDED